MAGNASGGLTESDLLDGDDDDGATIDGAEQGGGDDGESLNALGNEQGGLLEQGNDDLEVVLLDEDEGQDGEGRQAGETDADTRGDLSLDDDGGEVIDDRIGQDYLTPWERKNYSKAVALRIQRERRAKERIQAGMESRVAEALHIAKALQVEAFNTRKVAADLLLRDIDNSIKDKAAELKAAKEEADTDKEIKLGRELAALDAKRLQVSEEQERLKQVEQQGLPDIKLSDTAAAQPSETNRWKTRNKWYGDKRFAEETTLAGMIDSRLAQEHKAGSFAHAPGSTAYFQELDRRVKEKLPGLAARAASVFRPAPGAVRGGPTPTRSTAPARPAAAGQGRPRQIVLSAADQAEMRKWGLNPRNPKEARAWALENRRAG